MMNSRMPIIAKCKFSRRIADVMRFQPKAQTTDTQSKAIKPTTKRNRALKFERKIEKETATSLPFKLAPDPKYFVWSRGTFYFPM
jgi:hypothetical protein